MAYNSKPNVLILFHIRKKKHENDTSLLPVTMHEIKNVFLSMDT